MSTLTRRARFTSLLGAFLGTFVIVGGVLANDLNPAHENTAWDDPAFQGSEETCAADLAELGLTLDEGDVAWHFVQTEVAEGAVLADSELTATFDDAGAVTVDAYKQAGGVLHWYVVTGEDTLLDASSNVTSDGNLNLSHICSNPAGGGGGGGGGGAGATPSPDPGGGGGGGGGGGNGAMEDLPLGSTSGSLALALAILALGGAGLLVTSRTRVR